MLIFKMFAPIYHLFIFPASSGINYHITCVFSIKQFNNQSVIKTKSGKTYRFPAKKVI